MKTVRRLFQLSFMCLVLSLLGYMCVAVIELTQAKGGVVKEPVLLAFTALGAIFSLFALIALAIVEQLILERQARRNRQRRLPMIPLRPMDKEPGYNAAVNDWFLNGPELRQPGEEFSAGFKARAQVPPPKRGKFNVRSTRRPD